MAGRRCDVPALREGRAAAARRAVGHLTGPEGPVLLRLHHRGRAAPPGTGAVVLLRTALPATVADWAAIPAPPLPGLAAALDALPLAGGVPGWAPPGSWAFVDTAAAARRPAGAVTAGSPSVLSFDLDLSAVAVGTNLVLLALAHDRADPVALAAGGLRDAVLGSSHAAARTVTVVS